MRQYGPRVSWKDEEYRVAKKMALSGPTGTGISTSHSAVATHTLEGIWNHHLQTCK